MIYFINLLFIIRNYIYNYLIKKLEYDILK